MEGFGVLLTVAAAAAFVYLLLSMLKKDPKKPLDLPDIPDEDGDEPFPKKER